MKKTLSMILVLTLALALTVSSLSALAAAPVVAFSSEEPDANPQGENTPGGDGGSDTGGGTGGSSDTGGSGGGSDTGGGSGTGTGGDTDPSNPDNPSTPSGPSEPSNPSAPSDPSNPSNPSEPSSPSDPSDPSNPSDPSGPTNPTTPPTDPPTNPPTTPPVTSSMPVVTKHPTSENVREGGYAEFVARADSCLDIIWHLQNPGGSIDVLAEKAPNRFPGLVVTGLNSERLGLDHIPKELNEWRVRAEFVGQGGNVWSDPAVISVMNQELTAPTIQQQPASANLKPTEGTTLQISALSSERNTTLTYQWYKNTINSNVGGKAILGATTASFTPDYVPGTTYYYCAVRCTNGSEISAATKTSCAAVTYVTTPGQDSTVPSQQVSQEATVAPTASTLTPWDEATATEETIPPMIPDAPSRSNTLLLVVVGVIVLIAVLGIVATVIILRLYSDGRQEDAKQPVPAKHPAAPKRPAVPQRQASRPGSQSHTPKFAAKQPSAPPADEAPEWDDLSDLGDLSIYFDDEDE